MEKKFNIKKILNKKHFELAPSRLKCKFYASKFFFFRQIQEIKSPCIYVCHKTNLFDKFLISSFLHGNFVFLKDEVVQAVHNETLSQSEKKELFEELQELKDNNFSVVVFPEKHFNVFGKSEKLSMEITNFLYETKLDIKFLYLIGTYQSFPIWAKAQRKCETRALQQFKVEHEALTFLTKKGINTEINKFMPSSASVYDNKFPPRYNSNNLAVGLEQVFYCCPRCENLFSLYSEFNCIKCRECGSAIEFSRDGKILFSNKINSLDDIEDFLSNTIKKVHFKNGFVTNHPNVKFSSIQKNEKQKLIEIKIFVDKIELYDSTLFKTIKFSDVKDVWLDFNNTIFVELETESFKISGTNNENFYIIIDLFKLFKSK